MDTTLPCRVLFQLIAPRAKAALEKGCAVNLKVPEGPQLATLPWELDVWLQGCLKFGIVWLEATAATAMASVCDGHRVLAENTPPFDDEDGRALLQETGDGGEPENLKICQCKGVKLVFFRGTCRCGCLFH